MDDSTKNLWEVALGVAQLLAVMVTAAWVYFRFRREGVHNPAIQFDIECEFVGFAKSCRIIELAAVAENKGHIQHNFRRITVSIRGIREDDEVQFLEGYEPHLSFPHELVRFENLVTRKSEYFFVRPRVLQRFRAATVIEGPYTHLLVRADFEYEQTGDTHQAHRVFKVPD